MIPTAEPPKPAQSGQRQHRWKPKTWRKMKNKEPEYTHPAIIYQLKQLAENKDIHIMKADKGGAIVIQDTVDYDREAMRQLSDAETYKSLTLEEYMTQLKEAHTQMVDAAIILRNYGHISEKELDAIREAPLKGSAAYFLPRPMMSRWKPNQGITRNATLKKWFAPLLITNYIFMNAKNGLLMGLLIFSSMIKPRGLSK